MKELAIFHWKSSTCSWCEECDSIRPEATRSRAQMHAKKTGHKVVVVVEHFTIYKKATS